MIEKIVEEGLKLAWKGAVAGAAYLAATHATKKITGKHIHTHVIDWWGEFRDKITHYVHTHDMAGKEVILRVVHATDNTVAHLCRGGKRLVKLSAITRSEYSGAQLAKITEVELTEDEVLRQCPQFQQGMSEVLYA